MGIKLVNQTVYYVCNSIVDNPINIVLIAIPLIIQTFLIFFIAYLWAKAWKLPHNVAASAGTEKYPEVKTLAVEVMEEIGISMDSHYPKLIKDIPEEVDALITMGCGVVCPFLPSKHEEDWGLDDPSGGTIEDFRETRDIIS